MKRKPLSSTDLNFLSEEDLDLANLSDQELDLVWEAWFEAAQATNDQDADYFSHACFGYSRPGIAQESKRSKN